MIRFKCLYCEAYYEVPDEMANGKALCNTCNNYFIVPPYTGESVVQALPYGEIQQVSTIEPAPQETPQETPQKEKAPDESLYGNFYDDAIPIKPPSSARPKRKPLAKSRSPQKTRQPSSASNQKKRVRPSVKRKNGPSQKRTAPQKRHIPVQKKRGNYLLLVILLLLFGIGGGLAYKFASPAKSRIPSSSQRIVITDENGKKGKNDANLLPVERHGQLHIKGNKLIDSHGNQIALHGMSMFHCGDGFRFRNYECMKWLRDDWKCNVLRIAVLPVLYRKERESQNRYISEFIDNCIKLGIYVILDFHGGGPPMPDLKNAKAMFDKFSKKYADIPNIIYEPFNEPFGKPGKPPLSWSKDIKPYHEKIIRTIRKNDPDNIIILGTPAFSLRIDKIIADPVKIDPNIMYVAHFYAASHKHGNRKWVVDTLNAGYPVFISEFGTCEYTGDGKLDPDSTAQWIKMLDKYKVSWCNWSVHDKDETASILKQGSSSTGHWKKSNLRESGKLIRKYLRGDINLNSIKMEKY